MAVALDAVRSGKLRVLAVTTATRSDMLPDIPIAAEFVPGYVTFGFAGIGAPKGASNQIIALLNREINATLDDPEIRASLAERTLNPFHGSPADFGQLIADVIRMWREVVRVSGVKP
jgi:tripartite-type tricarboxylate transporter receptor subunit TctC